MAATCRAKKGRDQFSLREMVNSTRVVSTLKRSETQKANKVLLVARRLSVRIFDLDVGQD